MKGDGIEYDEKWDETMERFFLIQEVGARAVDIFDDCE